MFPPGFSAPCNGTRTAQLLREDRDDAMNKAIDHYILHEISELRSQERRLSVALAAAPTDSTSAPIVRTLARLHARMEEFDSVLDQLDVVAVTEPTAA
jgi:hypothetical protein